MDFKEDIGARRLGLLGLSHSHQVVGAVVLGCLEREGDHLSKFVITTLLFCGILIYKPSSFYGNETIQSLILAIIRGIHQSWG